MIKILLLLLSFILIISCGKSVEDKENENAEEVLNPDGTYAAVLVPVNYRLSSQIHGDVRVIKYGDEFEVIVSIKGAPSGKFSQHLHTGFECPRDDQDLNRDGFIDSYEARPHTGEVIVPLDGDLSSQFEGQNFVLQGNYSYSKSVSYFQMLSDLHLPDDVINDAIVKLPEKELPLERRVIVVYSIKPNVPVTISGEEVPVACGILTRIQERPVPEDDTIGDDKPPPRRPRRVPRRRPPPEPEPTPEPAPDPDNENDSWWSRWRDRWNDWWNGDDRRSSKNNDLED